MLTWPIRTKLISTHGKFQPGGHIGSWLHHLLTDCWHSLMQNKASYCHGVYVCHLNMLQTKGKLVFWTPCQVTSYAEAIFICFGLDHLCSQTTTRSTQHWLIYLCDDGTNGQLKLRFLTTLVYWQSGHVLVFVNKALWQFMNPEVVFNPPILMQCQNDQDPTWRRPRQSWQQRGLPLPVAKYQYSVCQTQQNSQNGCWHSKQECL